MPLLIRLACLSLLLSGCAIHPDYREPTREYPPQWYAPVTEHHNLESLAHWWQQFDDLSLVKLQTAAQQNNPSLDIALANIDTARANLMSITGRLYPRLDANARANQQQSGNAGGSGRIESQSASLDASWELNLFGATTFAKRASIAQLAAKRLDWHQARVSLAAEVATQYVQYRACQLSLNTLQAAKHSQAETARLTRIAADAGFRASAESALARANAATSASNVIAQRTTCQLLVKSLTALTQLPEPEVVTILAQHSKLPDVQGFKVTVLPANLIRQRPDIMAQERTLAAASAEIGVAKAALYPSITLNGSLGYQQTIFNGFSFKTNTWSFGPTLNLPLFDGGQRKAQVKSNIANFQLALGNYKQTVNNAIQEVEQNLIQLAAAEERFNQEMQAVADYQQFFEASNINWQAGGLDLLALEEARRQYINAQNNLITQQRDRILFWIALFKAFGGDWQTSDATPKQANAKDSSD